MPLGRFTGKVCILSGATDGIGLATARRLGLEGCKVVVSSRKNENVQKALDVLQNEGIEASGIPCHHGKKENRKRLIDYTLERYGRLDHVFMSAGANPHVGSLLTVTEEQFSKVFDINVKANFQFIQDCVPHLAERGGGSVVTNSTGAACDPGICTIGQDVRLYLISKLTLSALTSHVSRECWRKNVRINTVMPGIIDTKFLRGGVSEDSVFKHLTMLDLPYNEVTARLGTPEEIASVVAFLLTDYASYVNGECLSCTGGLSVGSYS